MKLLEEPMKKEAPYSFEWEDCYCFTDKDIFEVVKRLLLKNGVFLKYVH